MNHKPDVCVAGDAVLLEPVTYITFSCEVGVQWQKEGEDDYSLMVWPTIRSEQYPHKGNMLLSMTPEDADLPLRPRDNKERKQWARDWEDNTSRIGRGVLFGITQGIYFLILNRNFKYHGRKYVGLGLNKSNSTTFVTQVHMYPTAHEEYGAVGYKLDYERALRYRKGDVLEYRCSMSYGYCPKFKKFPSRAIKPLEGISPSANSDAEFPWLSKGVNVITNFQDIAWPIVRPGSKFDGDEPDPPGEEVWDTPLLESVRELRQVKPRDWSDLNWDVIGGFLELPILARVNIEDTEEEEDPEKKAEQPERRRSKGRNGQCFDLPHKRRSLVIPYRIYHCEGKDGETELPFFIVDSRLYGVALRIFATLEDATTYCLGGPKSEEADRRRLWWKAHDPEGKWREAFVQFTTSPLFLQRYHARKQELAA